MTHPAPPHNQSHNHSHNARHNERGNALIYVMIVIALFAALSFILSRNADTGEGSTIGTERVNILASQIMQSAARAVQGVEQMTYDGTPLAILSFVLPSESGFETTPPPNSRKVFHPDGGGVTLPALQAEAIGRGAITDPAPAFYLGRFNNVEWSANDALDNTIEDAVLVAYGIDEQICARINQNLTGDATIPVLAKRARAVFINRTPHHTGTNSPFETADCTGRSCEGIPALCVKDSSADIWVFYSLILAQR